jgi:hypothetical protein
LRLVDTRAIINLDGEGSVPSLLSRLLNVCLTISWESKSHPMAASKILLHSCVSGLDNKPSKAATSAAALDPRMMLVTVFPGSCEVEVARSKHATTRRLVTILRRSRKAEIDLNSVTALHQCKIISTKELAKI